jgi:hypothetical protein
MPVHKKLLNNSADLNHNFIDIDINSDQDTPSTPSAAAVDSFPNEPESETNIFDNLISLNHSLYNNDEEDDDDDDDDDDIDLFLDQTPTNFESKCTNLLTSTPHSHSKNTDHHNQSTDSIFNLQ